MSASPIQEKHRDARTLASRAVAADQNQDYALAYSLYFHLVELLLSIAQAEPDDRVRQAAITKATEYCDRAVIVKQLKETTNSMKGIKSHDNKLDHINFLFVQGMDYDEKKLVQNAYDAYVAGCELGLKYLEGCRDPKRAKEMSEKVSMILNRVEELRNASKGVGLLDKASNTASAPHPELSSREIDILKQASVINSRIFLPWIQDDKADPFCSQTLFVDPDGFLNLSREQAEKFGIWKRVSDIMKFPTMIAVISSMAIVQDVVTDCSFVASLCVSAAYELKFRKQLITSCVFPQDSSGMPVFNPIGKYVVKLFFNGIYRKIVVDDFLPLSKSGSLMCTYSTNPNEIWPSIIEKAYMKLNGGYDFPGSNSGIDLYALTGWIPEQIFIQDQKWNSDSQWGRLYKGFHDGHALITLATIAMSEESANKVGLVPSHAYAVLDVRNVIGVRMLQLKNPWNHRRWNGKYSHMDQNNWTRSMKDALGYDQLAAMQRDDGIFWIDFESVLAFFESIHVNWNPELFKYQHVMHVSWPLEFGPAVDTFALTHNPQYGLEVDAPEENSSVWLLLSKHITSKEENKDYITLHVYADTNCNRVHYPEMYKVIHVGVYVNNPHILSSFTVPKGKSRFSVVLSQHLKSRSLTFSLRAYAKHPFIFGTIGKRYAVEKTIRAEGAPGSLPLQHWLKIESNEPVDVFIMVEEESNAIVQLSLGPVTSGMPRPRFAFLEATLASGSHSITLIIRQSQKKVGYIVTVQSVNDAEIDIV